MRAGARLTEDHRAAITAWSAVSPFGLGRAALAAGLRDATPVTPGAVPEHWRVPDDRAWLAPDAALDGVLGRRGTRSMDRVTALAVAAVGQLLDDRERHRAVATGERAALVLGTTTGSAQSMMDFTRDSFVSERPFFVDPARFPNTVMNCAAGQCAIWHRLKGPNATVAGGRVAGLHALNYARRLLRAGRAGAVLCGAVEELSPARCWLEWHSRGPDKRDTALGEGCTIFLVELAPPDPPHADGRLADVLAIEFGAYAGADAGSALTACIRRAANRARIQPSAIQVVAAGGSAELAAVDKAIGDGATHLRPAEVLGDTGAASAAFQIAALLSFAERGPASTVHIGLVAAADTDGVVGCALLRIYPSEEA